MLEKDYIMRLIRQFFEALEKLIEKRGKEEGTTLQIEVNGMYRSYFHQPQDFFYEAGMDIILAYMQARFSEEECLQRMELLAELLRFDASLKPSTEEGQMLNEKADIIKTLFFDKKRCFFVLHADVIKKFSYICLQNDIIRLINSYGKD